MKPIEVKSITLLEFNMVLEGYIAREEEEWDRTRTLMSFVRAFSGVGQSKFLTPEEIFPLWKDRKNAIKPIRNYTQAMELLQSFRLN